MCGIVGRCVGGQKSAFGCMSLRTFMIVWVVVCGLIAVFEFIAGSYFTSAKKYIDEILLSLRLIAADAGMESGGNYYYEVLEKSFGTLWKTAFVLTAIRGLLDLAVTGIGIYGVWTKKSWALYTFLAVNLINFIVDFVLFLASIVLINSLYITWFYPFSAVFPFVLYGWQAILGPYFASLILSYTWIVGIGGNGAEMKSFYQLKEEQEKRSDSTSGAAKEEGGDTEAKPLLRTSSGVEVEVDTDTDIPAVP